VSFTSGFVDDVVFSYYGPNSSVSLTKQRHCSVVYKLTPLPHAIDCNLSYRRRQAPILDESFVKGLLGRSICDAPLHCSLWRFILLVLTRSISKVKVVCQSSQSRVKMLQKWSVQPWVTILWCYTLFT